MLRFILMLLILFLPCTAQAEIIEDPKRDYRNLVGKDARQWLLDNNWMFERDADDEDEARVSFDKEKGLVIEALDEAQAIFALKKGHATNYQDIVLKWGVDKFPKGASYAKGNRNEAIMFYAFFGTELIDSGSFIVPDSPYFIAIHLCENDELNKPEKGRFYHEGGRFVCVAHPKPGEVVTTRFNLKKAFQDYFGFNAPPLYGVAFEFDTKGAPDDGKTSAFIQQIHLPAASYHRED
jgi:hypothetical protein